jgi:hypothetical protein
VTLFAFNTVAVSGPWTDAVYLSLTGIIDVNSQVVGIFPRDSRCVCARAPLPRCITHWVR